MQPDAPRTCPVCASEEWGEFVRIRTGRIITGDQRIVPGHLGKVICRRCGVVANARILSPEELDRLYGDEYILNTQSREEHRFFTKNGAIARSQVFFDWIAPWLPGFFQTFLEIGCGAGNVLGRFAEAFPGQRVLGLDGSHQACALAKSKGLNVERSLIPGERPLPEADVILAINVLEHVEDVGSFLAAIRTALSDTGRAFFALPVQDYPGYDLFFAEHVWHFTARQILTLLARHGFSVIFEDTAHPVNHGIGLFVCEKAPSEEAPWQTDLDSVTRNRDLWLSYFSAVNTWLGAYPGKRIALFGASEIATLFLAFTSLGDSEPVACIDEDPSRQGTLKHGIPVVPLDLLEVGGVDAVILAVNPKYHGLVRDKLKKYPIDIVTFIEKG